MTTKRRLGPDAQVDDKALVIDPTDPSLCDPFLVLSEDWFSTPGFEWHPHRGLETVTTVLDGVLEHGDNLGNAGALHPGDVQWMTAGRGIIHRELAFRDEHAHTLQLWLNLPADDKMAATRYQDVLAVHRPRITLPGAVVDVVSGTILGVGGPALNHWPVQGAMVTVDPGALLAYPLPADHRAFAYVTAGSVDIAGHSVRTGQVAWSDPTGEAAVETVLRLAVPDRDEQAKVLIYSGRPIRQPIAFGGSFVMNDQQQIAEAYRDFQSGVFGEVPRQARLKYDR
ncbi:MAG TPA: pirin family protein [Pseudonocardiaceae bacterium]|nr:pirin family protein [Pseudonocardiaceae bacterium]